MGSSLPSPSFPPHDFSIISGILDFGVFSFFDLRWMANIGCTCTFFPSLLYSAVVFCPHYLSVCPYCRSTLTDFSFILFIIVAESLVLVCVFPCHLHFALSPGQCWPIRCHGDLIGLSASLGSPCVILEVLLFLKCISHRILRSLVQDNLTLYLF